MRCCARIQAIGVLIAVLSGPWALGVDRSYRSCPDACQSNGPACPAVAINDFQTSELLINVPSDSQGNFITRVSVSFWLTHTYQGDLTVELVSPAGSAVRLVQRPGGGGFSADNFGQLLFTTDGCVRAVGMYLDDDATLVYNPFTYASPQVPAPGWTGGFNPSGSFIVSGSYLPIDPLASFNGQNKTGVWRLRVTDSANGDTGLLRYFELSTTSVPLSQPIASISVPTDFACTCNPSTITGTASDPNVGLASYLLEWSTSANGPWSFINSGTAPVTNGPLGNWNSTSAGEGLRYLRLTATNLLGLSSTFVTVAYADQGFSSLAVNSPLSGSFWRDSVCISGTIADYCFADYRLIYAAPPYVSFDPINGGPSNYTTQVTNGLLGSWNIASLPDGPFRLRVFGNTTCGTVASVQRDIIVDNTPPLASILTPQRCTQVGGVIGVIGTASDANLSNWKLEVTGGAYAGWVTIATGASNVTNGLLGVWNTIALPKCAYTLRLTVSDQATTGCCGSAGATSEFYASIDIAQPGQCDDIDFNNDGGLFDPQDIEAFLSVFSEGPCL